MRQLVCAALLVLLPGTAFGWGNAGHQMIGEVAARHFPVELPAFLRTKDAVSRIGLLSQEPDTLRGSGQPHDADLDPGHFLDLSDDGTVHGGPTLSALPPTREDYDASLRAVGSDEYKMGFLPYDIMDGWQQLVHDFALLRVYRAALSHAGTFHLTPADRRAYVRLVSLRQLITLRDLGTWAHFVEDASQPMHVSVHYNGWGDGPNPEGFVTTPGLHAKFESVFVGANLRESDIESRMAPLHACNDTLQSCTQAYLADTAGLLVKVYQLEKQGAFDTPTPQSKAFAAERLAVAASMLRDRVVDAWRASDRFVLGVQVKTPVTDYEAGKALIPLEAKN